MSNDFAVDPQASEAGLSEEWRGHVRELRQENARRRKENQELRANLAALSTDAEQAKAAQAAAAQRTEREASRLATVNRRLKELEASRLAREALHEAVSGHTAEGGCGTRVVDLSRAQRLLERLPSPLDLDADLTVDDEGRVALEPAADERLKGFVEEVVGLLAVDPRVAAPPVGGEPPRPARPSAGPAPNSWDAASQRSPAGKARAALRQAAAGQSRILDEAVQL